jgi:hypothetical protein
MQESATKQHEWLMQLIGEWSFEHSVTMGENGETSVMSGKEIYRPIGKLWIVGELTSPVPDGPDITALTTLGFDPKQSAFVGNWIGSPMTHMYIYKGNLDDSGNVLTLDCSGPSFDDPTKTSSYQDIVEMVSPGERRFASQVLGDDGKWNRFLEGVFRKVN